mmetsp:Transcript_34127/g.70503  ORF Transcript_34127/g.70503 Transcript_34127/m.70503 type:complete len:213 (-) Transcript_34127:150-788(-)
MRFCPASDRTRCMYLAPGSLLGMFNLFAPPLRWLRMTMLSFSPAAPALCAATCSIRAWMCFVILLFACSTTLRFFVLRMLGRFFLAVKGVPFLLRTANRTPSPPPPFNLKVPQVVLSDLTKCKGISRLLVVRQSSGACSSRTTSFTRVQPGIPCGEEKAASAKSNRSSDPHRGSSMRLANVEESVAAAVGKKVPTNVQTPMKTYAIFQRDEG